MAVEELCSLGAPVIDDVGSGNLAEGLAAVADEPPVRRSVTAGAALVCFSGDKLLGGPQAGILVGRAEAIVSARAHPLARALRVDKLSLAALGATLRLYRDPARARAEVPVLAMLDAPEAQLAARAAALNGRLAAAGVVSEVVRRTAKVGGARSRCSSWRARWSRWIPASWQPASSRGGSGSRPSVTSRDAHPSSPASSASGCCSIPGR